MEPRWQLSVLRTRTCLCFCYGGPSLTTFMLKNVNILLSVLHLIISTCKRFGQQAWVVAAIVSTEVLICIKFGWETISIPLPMHVAAFWILFFGTWTLWTVWNFWPSIIDGFGVHHHDSESNGKTHTQHRPKRE